jgi:hypothetical protein
LAINDRPGAVSGENPTDQNCGGDRNRGTKTEAPSKNAPKAKAISSTSCKRAVWGNPADRLLQRRKSPSRHRQPVHEDDVEHDPADRKEADDRAEDAGADREPRWHREQEDGDDDHDEECNKRGEMSLDRSGGDQDEQRNDRDRSGDRRQHRIAERVATCCHIAFPLNVLRRIPGLCRITMTASPFFDKRAALDRGEQSRRSNCAPPRISHAAPLGFSRRSASFRSATAVGQRFIETAKAALPFGRKLLSAREATNGRRARSTLKQDSSFLLAQSG